MEFVKDKALLTNKIFNTKQNLMNQFKSKNMEKNLYIDASHPNETRVVLKSENNIEDYEYEGLKNTLNKK